VLFLVKTGLALVLLYWLTSSGRLELSPLQGITWSPLAVGLVVAGVGGVGAGLLLLGWRLCLIAGSLGIALPLRSAFSLTAIGAFAGSVLPGVVGGDVVKIVYLCRGEASSQRTNATAAVIVDRALGLFSLFLLGTIVLVAAEIAGALPFRSPVLFIAPAIVLAAVGAALLMVNRRSWGPVFAWKSDQRLPKRVQQAMQVGDYFSQRPGLLAGCIGLSLANHILVCCTFLVGARLLQVFDVSPLQQFLLNPLAMVINVIPVTPGGVGITESAFSYLYDAAGSDLGATIGLLGRTMQYLVYVAAGFPAFILRGK
jgi:hypothetical protein